VQNMAPMIVVRRRRRDPRRFGDGTSRVVVWRDRRGQASAVAEQAREILGAYPVPFEVETA